MGYMLNILSKIFVKITSVTESIYNRNKDVGMIWNIIIQLLYSATISIITGFLLHVITVGLLPSILNINYLSKSVLSIFIIPAFLFTMCVWIIGYNLGDKNFRFSKYMIRIYLLSSYISGKKMFWKSALYLLVMPLILSIFPTVLIIGTDISEIKLWVIYKIILIITFIISLILYSEFKADELERSKRQVFLWGIIFIVVLALNMYQYNYVLSSSIVDQQQIINLIISIGGLVFTLLTINDKTREMYKKLIEKHDGDVKDAMLKLMKQNNYNKVTKLVKEYTTLFGDMISILQSKWKAGDKRYVVKFILIIISACTVIITMSIWSDFINRVLTYIISDGKNFFIFLFDGDEDLEMRVFVIATTFVCLIYVSYKTIKKFKKCTISEKINNINLIIIIMIVFIMCLSTIFNKQVQHNISYIISGLGIIFVIGCIVQAVLSKIKK